MLRPFLPSFAAFVALVAFSAGCSSESGEACRATRECSSGLVCCNGGTIAAGGKRGACQRECVLIVEPDAGSTEDAGADASEP